MVRVAEALCEALRSRQIDAVTVPVNGDLGAVTDLLHRRPPDLVINLCESLVADSRGEMVLPCLLDALKIPYTGSSALSLGLALHKNKAKEILFARGVPTPEFRVVESIGDLVAIDLPFPLIVKPAREDASVGVDLDSVVYDRPSLGRAALQVLRSFAQPALVERYIEGREIYVPLLGNRPRRSLPLTEIHFGRAFEAKPKIVSYRAKWDEQSPEFIDSPSGPCSLDPITEARLVKAAQAAFDALECRDYGRVDLRLSADGQPYVIDINPNCDLHPEAGYAKAAAAEGMSYADLALRLVEIALERTHGNKTNRRTGPGTGRRAPSQNRNLLAAGSGVRSRARRPRAQAEQP